MKKYTLKEAFDRRLLYDGDSVEVSSLYKPYKRILYKYRFSETWSFSYLSLEDFFGNEFGKNQRLGKARIHFKDGSIFVRSEWAIYSILSSEQKELIAKKLLTIPEFKIEAQYDLNSRNFVINLGPDTLVEFDAKDDFPILKLPMHTVYTC